MPNIIDPDYQPRESDIIVEYQITPPPHLSFPEFLHELLKAFDTNSLVVFHLDQRRFRCHIAFPETLFEAGNMSQILSLIAGVLFDETSHHASIKIIDVSWPSRLQASFPGPSRGIDGMRALYGIFDRPISSVILRPHQRISNCLEEAYHLWMGGCDIVEESDLLSSLPTNEFYERISYLSEEQKNCSNRTKKRKIYIPNISAGNLNDMGQRAKKVREAGLDHVVVNAFQIGFVGVSSLRSICQECSLILCANRSGQSLYSGNALLQISPKALASLYRLLGVDQLHMSANPSEETKNIAQGLSDPFSHQASQLQTTFPVLSLVSRIKDVETLIKHFGHDIVLQAKDAIYQHPDGVKAGAEAFQTAIEAAFHGIDQMTAAKKSDALKRALEIS